MSGSRIAAMDVNDDAGILTPRGALRFFASRLAPAGIAYSRKIPVGCQAAFAGKPAPTGFSRFSPIKRCKNAYNVVISAYTFILYKYLII